MTGFERIINNKNFYKLIIWVIVIIVVIIIYKEAKKYIQSSDSTSRQYGNAVNESNVTLSNSELSGMADRLFIAMNGGGTDPDEIYDVLNLLSTEDDWNKLVKVYGVRETTSWISSWSGNLIKWLTDELSGGQKQKVRQILANINVQF